MGKPVVVTVNVPALPTSEGGVIVAGDGGGLIDGEGEGLGRLGIDPVGCGDAQRIGAAAARGRRPAERRRPVLVVQEGDASGQGAALAEGAVGKPVVVTVNVPALPTVKVVSLSLVIAGA